MTLWVLVVVALLAFEVFVMLLHLPRILAAAWAPGETFGNSQAAFGDGQVLSGMSSGLPVRLLALPIVGILLVLTRPSSARSARRPGPGRGGGGGGTWSAGGSGNRGDGVPPV